MSSWSWNHVRSLSLLNYGVPAVLWLQQHVSVWEEDGLAWLSSPPVPQRRLRYAFRTAGQENPSVWSGARAQLWCSDAEQDIVVVCLCHFMCCLCVSQFLLVAVGEWPWPAGGGMVNKVA